MNLHSEAIFLVLNRRFQVIRQVIWMTVYRLYPFRCYNLSIFILHIFYLFHDHFLHMISFMSHLFCSLVFFLSSWLSSLIHIWLFYFHIKHLLLSYWSKPEHYRILLSHKNANLNRFNYNIQGATNRKYVMFCYGSSCTSAIYWFRRTRPAGIINLYQISFNTTENKTICQFRNRTALEDSLRQKCGISSCCIWTSLHLKGFAVSSKHRDKGVLYRFWTKLNSNYWLEIFVNTWINGNNNCSMYFLGGYDKLFSFFIMASKLTTVRCLCIWLLIRNPVFLKNWKYFTEPLKNIVWFTEWNVFGSNFRVEKTTVSTCLDINLPFNANLRNVDGRVFVAYRLVTLPA